MKIFKREHPSIQGKSLDIGAVTSPQLQLNIEPGESFVINTPLGQLVVERTGDTFTITSGEEEILLSLDLTNNKWKQMVPFR